MSEIKPVDSFYRMETETAIDVLSRVQEMVSSGREVVNLGAGQPDMSPPQHVIDACAKAMRDGHNGYTSSLGILPLREAVAEHLNNLHSLQETVDPKSVMIIPGGKFTIFQAIMLLGEKNVEISYPNPGFPIYGSMVNFTGATHSTYRLKPELNFTTDVDSIIKSLTSKTRLLILNNPSNPTGGFMKSSEVDRLAEELKNYPNLTILSDEIYSRLVFDGHEFRSLLCYPWLRDRLILLDGWSKSYAMTGWRVGMAVWPKSLIKYAEKLSVNAYSCVNTPAQWGALAALTGPQDSVYQMCKVFQRRRDLVCKIVKQSEHIECNFPEGAFYAFLNLKKIPLETKLLQEYLLEECGVALIAGTNFGSGNQGFLRLSFASSDENIEKGLTLVQQGIERLM